MIKTIFFKLDTHQIRNFDSVLGDGVKTILTKKSAVLRRLVKRQGLVNAFKIWLTCKVTPNQTAWKAVQGNIDRKRIRIPAFFGNPIIKAVYGHIKAGQAAMLRETLIAELAVTDPDLVIIYNGSLYPESVLSNVTIGRKRVFVESGFFPNTLQIDPNGLNAANSVPRDPAFYLTSETDFAAAGLPENVITRVSKISDKGIVYLEPGYVFVPFQVPSDMQVTLHSPWVRDMEQFLDLVIAAADRNPEETFVIKEHPSFKRSVKGIRPTHPRVIFANGNVTSHLIKNARSVMTLNSTVGIEGILFDKPVITLADAYYNIEGLVFHVTDVSQLDRSLQETHGWSHNQNLRRQFLGYLWNSYLMHGQYDAVPTDLAQQLQNRVSSD
jgi:capsular polysaccharide export protein